MSVYAWRYWCKECGWWDAEISAEDARWIMHRQRISPVLLDGESYPGQAICPSCDTPSTQTLPTQVQQRQKLSMRNRDSERVSHANDPEAVSTTDRLSGLLATAKSGQQKNWPSPVVEPKKAEGV